MDKTCTYCKETKPLEDFPRRYKNDDTKRASRCYVCQRIHVKAHYDQNVKYYVEKARRNNATTLKKNRAWLLEYFMEHPCVDCGTADSRVLTFDHRDPASKIDCISNYLRGYSTQKMMAEIEKCDVRCANCHMIRTSEQFGYWRSA